MKWIGIFIGVLLMALFASQIADTRVLKAQNDFLQFYGGAELVGTGHLHDPAAMRAVQMRVAGVWLPAVLYVRPDYYAVLLKPLSWLPFSAAYAMFQLANLAALLGFLWLERRNHNLKWLAVMSIPLVVSFANGQDVPLLLFFIALGMHLYRRGLPFWAGVCFTLCTIKLHFLVFVPVVLLLWRQWHMIAGGAVSFGALTALAARFEGWDWVLRYPAVVRNPIIHPNELQFLNLRGIAKVIPGGDAWALTTLTVVGIGAILATLWLNRNRNFEHSIAIALLGGMLVSFHLGFHDCALLLAVFALAVPDSVLSKAAIVLSFPAMYFLLLFNGLIGAVPAIMAVIFLAQILLELLRNPPEKLNFVHEVQ